MILYKMGRFLQGAGLLIAPTGVAFNVADPVRVNLKAELLIAAVGIGLFTLGWLLQQTGRPD